MTENILSYLLRMKQLVIVLWIALFGVCYAVSWQDALEEGDVDQLSRQAVRQAFRNHWVSRMEERFPHLQEMNPFDHFHHVLGDIHVMMDAGRTYRSKVSELDFFGSPRFHDSTLRPKYHIFNSDWDDSIQDVLVEGRHIVIRTSRPEAMMNIKLRPGHVLGTGLDWTVPGDEEHPGPRHFLVTQEPEEIQPGLILLENTIEMEYDDLWQFARVHMSVQNYQWSQNGRNASRALPGHVKIHHPSEEGYDLRDHEEGEGHLHKRGLGDIIRWGKRMLNKIGNGFVSAYNGVKNAVNTVVEVITAFANLATTSGGADYSFNYNAEEKTAYRKIPIYPWLVNIPSEKEGNPSSRTPSPSPPPSPSRGKNSPDVKGSKDFKH